ncbi:MAG: hypothetical protein A2804_03075 [Candidatus Pacebacteria bacterium RIFCSPHIGHO2_01_FULL_46_10]|nr:MAG: hypothetical protein A2804_03075 [Candidatus Pacebacteria bacterium RIFCSPHIGHO2_01_FULL_46_10]
MDQNNKKLFVGNLDYTVTSEDIKEFFSQFGTVTDAIVLTDKFSGRSKGFGFVTFETEDMATAAVNAANEMEFKGRKLNVSIAKPPKPREDRGFGGGGGYNRGGGAGGGGSKFSRGGGRGGY